MIQKKIDGVDFLLKKDLQTKLFNCVIYEKLKYTRINHLDISKDTIFNNINGNHNYLGLYDCIFEKNTEPLFFKIKHCFGKINENYFVEVLVYSYKSSLDYRNGDKVYLTANLTHTLGNSFVLNPYNKIKIFKYDDVKKFIQPRKWVLHDTNFYVKKIEKIINI